MNDLRKQTIQSLTWKAVRKQTKLATTQELKDGVFVNSLEDY